MSLYIPRLLRFQVINRANYCCEYCRLNEEDAFFSHQIDHVIPIKHGGETLLDNLALACSNCNKNKGSDIATVFYPQKKIVGLFNPRLQTWVEHFLMDGFYIQHKTEIGEATIKVLKMNDIERIMERKLLNLP